MRIVFIVLAFYITSLALLQPTSSLEFYPKDEKLTPPLFDVPDDTLHNSEVTVRWDHQDGPVAGYYLVYYVCTTPHIKVTISIPKNETKHNIMDLIPDTTYVVYMLTYSLTSRRFVYYDNEANMTLERFETQERYSHQSDKLPIRTPLRDWMTSVLCSRSTITAEEVIILITVFLLWILVIVLFFRQWGVIRDLQPRSSGSKYRRTNTDVSREGSKRSAKSQRDSIRDRDSISIRDRDSIIRHDSVREREPFLDRVSVKEKLDLIVATRAESEQNRESQQNREPAPEPEPDYNTFTDDDFYVDIHYDCEQPEDDEEPELDSKV